MILKLNHTYLIAGLVLISGCDEVLVSDQISSNQDWHYICFSGQYEVPDMEIGDLLKDNTCWRTTEVPGKTVFITYIDKLGICSKQRTEGYFLQERNSETRCVERNDFTGLEIEDGVLKLK